MTKNIKQILRPVIPEGLLLWRRRWNRLRDLGYDTSPLNLPDINRAYSGARVSRLDLLPDGTLQTVRTLVDVGANHGHWTENALKCVDPEDALLLEPAPSAFQDLESKFGGREDVHLYDIVAGEEVGSVNFNVMKKDDLSSTLNPSKNLTKSFCAEVESTIEKKIYPLDNILDRFEEISILRVDVQGGGMSVLRGAKESIKKPDF